MKFPLSSPGLSIFVLPLLLGLSPSLPAQASEGFAAARFVPERKDDFAFENDQVAFRIYGPALKSSTENSGIDCWLKRVDYPIIDKWYRQAQEGKSYHKDHGEGFDPYHVGASLGCGGLALWVDGQMRLSNVYRNYRILKNGPDQTIFEIEYVWEDLPDETREVRRFTLAAGSRMFKAESQFFIDGQAAQVEVAIGVSTHDGQALPYADSENQWIASWEQIKGSGLGTGVALIDHAKAKILTIDSATNDQSNIVFVAPTDAQGKIVYYAGFAWQTAGEITTPSQWKRYLEQFCRTH